MLRAPSALSELIRLIGLRVFAWALLILFLIVLTRVWSALP